MNVENITVVRDIAKLVIISGTETGTPSGIPAFSESIMYSTVLALVNGMMVDYAVTECCTLTKFLRSVDQRQPNL